MSVKTVNNRYDIAYFFDIADGNPNGDPDAGNLPRIDPETGEGLVTDVCLKRKVRNYVALAKGETPPFEIYVKERAILNNQNERAYEALELKPDKGKMPKDEAKAREVTAWMCRNFYDIRTFGAVMSTEVNCGQVRGAIQLGFSRSAHPVVSAEHAVTRCAVTTKGESEEQGGGNRTMGRKFTIPYALYRCHIFINPHLAAQTGFTDEDLQLFKTALNQMFENDRSAARGMMAPRRCIAFKHESSLGNARADQLFARVKVARAGAIETSEDPLPPPRSFAEYAVTIDAQFDLPSGVTIEEWV